MGSTLLSEIKVYEHDGIYAVLENVAEKNVYPHTFHWYPAACDRDYRVMYHMAKMAAGIYSGELHWKERWGETYGFLTHAEKMLKTAIHCDGRIPELYHFNVFYFKPDAPMAETWHKVAANLEHYEIANFFDEKVLRLKYPTVKTLYDAYSFASAISTFCNGAWRKISRTIPSSLNV